MKSFTVVAIVVGLAFIFGTQVHATTPFSPSPTACPEIWAPVCGYAEKACETARCTTLYRTYSNTCFLNADEATLVHEGECTAKELAPGSQPPADGGQYVPPQGCMAWYDGCNHCSRGSASGPAICTLMACRGDLRWGYCTSYDNNTPGTPTPEPPSDGDTPTTTHINSDGETVINPSNPPPLGDDARYADSFGDNGFARFFFHTWSSITDWFSELF